MKSSLLLTAFLAGMTWAGASAQERLFVEAKVNGTPLRMAFDTASQWIFFHGSTAERLGLKTARVKTFLGKRDYFGTEKCKVEFWGGSLTERVHVLMLPSFLHPEEEGMIGWEAVRTKVFEIDALNHTVRFLREVPKDVKSWNRLRLEPGWRIFTLHVPDGSGVIVVDTGSESGIGIPPNSWRRWKDAHPDQAVTLESGYMPLAGIFVREQAWAADFPLGPVAVTDVVVEEADPTSFRLAGKKLVATLGLAALKRLDCVVDGKHQAVYLRPNSAAAPKYNHNRLGAVFVPRDSKSDELVAQVVEGGPAFGAGIRNGDVLLKIGEEAMTSWRTDTSHIARISWTKPAGTQVPLTLRRSNETFSTTATLREIVGPSSKRL